MQSKSDGSMTAGGALTMADVEQLRREPSTAQRAMMAEKVSLLLTDGQLGEAERKIARSLIEILARDAEIVVRERLARALQYSLDLPVEVAKTFAFDVLEVAEPILRHALVLEDSDLLAVIARCSSSHCVAVAQRPHVSAEVSGALIARKDETIAAALLANAGARIDEPGYHLVVDTFGSVPRIMDMVTLREALPMTVVERIVTLVADSVRERLAARYEMAPAQVAEILAQAREHLLLSTIEEDADPDDIEDLVRALVRKGDLTPTLILRALCMGEFVFVALAFAHMAGIQFVNAWQLLLDRGHSGSEQLYDRCWLPPRLKPVYRDVLAVAARYSYTGDTRLRGPYRSRVHEWGAAKLGVSQSVIGFDQMVTRLLLTVGAVAAERRVKDGSPVH
jgi:uncharacterized protein (DUF2336 family)